ncbi:hypothetical protein D3C81_1286720 [compost metagenome]
MLEHALAACGPGEAGFGNLLEEGRGERALGGPQANRGLPEAALMAAPGSLELGGDPRAATGVGGCGGQRALRQGLAGDIEVEQQRRQRVVGGRAAEFDLPGFGQRPVAGDQTGQDAGQFGEQALAVLLVELAALGHQLGNDAARAAQGLAAPGQQIPGGEVGEVVVGEIVQGIAVLFAQQIRQVAQTPVGGEGLQHGRGVAVKGVVEQPGPVGLAQGLRRRRVEDAQQGVAPLAVVQLSAVVLDLLEQHRDEIDRAVHAGVPLQVAGHVGVILERVQQHPGQDELAGLGVPVVRLVHVPEQGEIGHGGYGRQAEPWPSIVAVTRVTPRGLT